MKRKRAVLLALVMLLSLSLGGCALLPTETSYVSIPLVKEYNAPEYQMAYVQRGEFAITETVSCRYMPVREAMLSFGVSGVYYDAIYAAQGDLVKEGDLLATLEMGSLAIQIRDAQLRLDELTLAHTQLLAQQALAVRQHQALLSAMTVEERVEALGVGDVMAQYDQRLQTSADALYLQQLTLASLEERRAQREIRAPMEGTVTYIRRITDNERSVEGQSFLRVADLTHSVFVASTERWADFTPGDEVIITSSRVQYEAVVTTAEDLGIKADTDTTAKKRSVYFSLTAPAPELEDGDQGATVLTLEYRPDTLYINSNAVHSVNGRSIVYYVDEETGIRTFKEIETGLEANRLIEVTGGLAEGEGVILK